MGKYLPVQNGVEMLSNILFILQNYECVQEREGKCLILTCQPPASKDKHHYFPSSYSFVFEVHGEEGMIEKHAPVFFLFCLYFLLCKSINFIVRLFNLYYERHQSFLFIVMVHLK
jgi:hypothetical protein